MITLNDYISEYIEYCEYRKRLDSKTLKATSFTPYQKTISLMFQKLKPLFLSFRLV